jgi:hypothetical protein
MFNVSEWLKSALISGVTNGTLAREFVVTKTVDYLLKGLFVESQVQEIAAAIEPVVEPEPVVEDTEAPAE